MAAQLTASQEGLSSVRSKQAICILKRSRDSSVGIETGYGLDDREFAVKEFR
jgi:hypothetical protein